MFDYLIVGAGLFGATLARMLTDKGNRCMVIERRNYIGGNCADYEANGIWIGLHGGHIFHTNDKRIWDYANEYADFWPYQHQVIANYKGMLYPLPINLMTLHKVYGNVYVAETVDIRSRFPAVNGYKRNLESWAISQVGEHLYERIFRGYTIKQWGCDPTELPASIARRIPIRLNHDGRYFSDRYQGIPIGGYSAWIEKMLDGVEVHTNTDFLSERIRHWRKGARQIIYSGPVDELFDYDMGALPYRSLVWEHEWCPGDYPSDYLGIATMNFTDIETPYTRVIEWKHFMETPPKEHTVISREYSQEWHQGAERYYPIPTIDNRSLAQAYRDRAKEQGVVTGGRLGTYRYLDMHQAIGQAMAMAERL